ncbi:MAG: GAF domain-containing protein [Flammeovirgaceae bacterium]
MAEQLLIDTTQDKATRYQSLLPQIEGLIADEVDGVANLAHIAAALKEAMGFFWVGFYIVKNSATSASGQELVLGPFQGPIACTRIGFAKGVCGACWKEKKVMLVPNVDEFPGHIACSSASKSEIVLPAFKNNEVALVLDVDSDQLNDFDAVDEEYLTQLMGLIERFI